ncbi:MAG: type II toxin-antitoxin system prevent-host-death family antitoxin [Nitrospira sp.]|nr:type II toxin-antitoxin system prevent-host-death family antitoxin [Nitrospira sp.]MDE0405071.1 type II toxin-antitoxin system prevent-host-death family antitoxin [Nitrospira sp.]MDE0486077.1 type II toxin-antitoxin system prevent-host-death family antitoxin [Nitrospira sp.]
MREVQATEAKTHLAQLLSAVERGETIAITRHGKPVAHLVPAKKQDRTARKEAVERFKAWRASWKGIDMSIEDILAARHEGHHY